MFQGSRLVVEPHLRAYSGGGGGGGGMRCALSLARSPAHCLLLVACLGDQRNRPLVQRFYSPTPKIDRPNSPCSSLQQHHSDPGWAYNQQRHSNSGSSSGPNHHGNSHPHAHAHRQHPQQQQQYYNQQPGPGGAPPQPPPPSQPAPQRPHSPGASSGLPAHLSMMIDGQSDGANNLSRTTSDGQRQSGAAHDGSAHSGGGGYHPHAHQQHPQQPQQPQAVAVVTYPVNGTAAGTAGRVATGLVAGAAPGASGPAGAALRQGPLLVPDLVKQLAGRVDLLTSLLRCPICRVSLLTSGGF
jgi:hypothetical protein